jgi:hypothetical protein
MRLKRPKKYEHLPAEAHPRYGEGVKVSETLYFEGILNRNKLSYA